MSSVCQTDSVQPDLPACLPAISPACSNTPDRCSINTFEQMNNMNKSHWLLFTNELILLVNPSNLRQKRKCGEDTWCGNLNPGFGWVRSSWASAFLGWSRSVQFSSVAQSCPTLCDPMNHSTPGLPVHHQFPEFTQTHVHQVGDAIQPSHLLSSPSPPAPNPSQHQSLFQWVNSSHEVAKVLEVQL